MLPANLRNPFHTHKADDTLALPAGDVPDLHAGLFGHCTAALAHTRLAGTSVGVLLVGEAGSGKSHLLTQLRHHVNSDPAAVLATIRMGKAYTGRLWRHVREKLVEELLRQFPDPRQGANGLLRVLRNQFPKWAAQVQSPSGGLLDYLVGRGKEADLAPHLQEFAQKQTFDYNLQKVLPQLAAPEVTTLATAWLQGKSLGTRDLDRLGLAPVHLSDQEQEVQAHEVVAGLLQLAGTSTTLMVCFDEVEALQAGKYDASALQQFATMATALLGESGPRVVLTSIRPKLQVEFGKVIELANQQKMGQRTHHIFPLTWEQTVQLVLARLEAEPSCRAARPAHSGERFWPLTEAFLRPLHEERQLRLTARQLIDACAAEFDRVVAAKPVDPPQDDDPKARSQEFSRLWRKHVSRIEEKKSSQPFDTVFGRGLPWLAQLGGSAFTPVPDSSPKPGDVNLVFQPTARGKKPLAVSFCNQSPHALWPRLDRLKKQWAAAKGATLGALVVLRLKHERTTTKALDRLAELVQAGVRVILVEAKPFAELAAFQAMLAAAHEGKLTRNGLPIAVDEYEAWVKRHVSTDVQALLQQVFAPEARGRAARAKTAAGK